MTTELATRENGSVAEIARPSSGLALSFAEMTMRVRQLDEFYRDVMQDGTDYGVIPGTQKPSLYQPGAQMLDQIFGLVPSFEVVPTSVIDWQRPIPFFHYIVRCRLLSRKTAELVAEAIGSCNTHEDRYRWRTAKRLCPACNLETIIKGKQEYGGGWLCFKRNGGCGAKYRDGDTAIEGQQAGRVENEDTASLENTVLKMAQKRAHVAATLNATGASRIFTQDVEDLPQFQQATVVQSTSAPAEDDHPFDAGTQGGTTTPGRSAGAATSSDRATNGTSVPADEKNRATFEANWKRGCEKAISVGVAPDDKPDEKATVGELRKALSDLQEAIQAREKLNAELLAQIAQVREAGAEVADVEPWNCTDVEIHQMLASLAEMLDGAPDPEAF